MIEFARSYSFWTFKARKYRRWCRLSSTTDAAWAVQLAKNIVQLQRKSKRIGELDRGTLAYPPYSPNYLRYNLNGEEFSNYEDVKTGWENIVTQNERTKGF